MPDDVYMCEGFCRLELPPSPKSQFQDEMPPTGTLELSVNCVCCCVHRFALEKSGTGFCLTVTTACPDVVPEQALFETDVSVYVDVAVGYTQKVCVACQKLITCGIPPNPLVMVTLKGPTLVAAMVISAESPSQMLVVPEMVAVGGG
jgi:hypothetical protein